MSWSYDSEFFGKDVLAMPAGEGRALIGTYQNIGLLGNDSELTVLTPGKAAEAFRFDAATREQHRIDVSDARLADVITYYQRAADLFASRSRDMT